VSLSGTARDLEIYLTSDTLRMGIFGYALQLPRSEVQRVVTEFYKAFSSLLQTYNSKDQCRHGPTARRARLPGHSELVAVFHNRW